MSRINDKLTLAWNIENFRFLKEHENVVSPYLIRYLIRDGRGTISDGESYRATIRLSEGSMYVSLLMFCCITHKFSVAFLNSYGTPLIWKENSINGSDNVIQFSESELSLLINKLGDTLKVECCVWTQSSQYSPPPIPALIFARTRIEPHVQLTENSFYCEILNDNESYLINNHYSPWQLNHKEQLGNGETLTLNFSLDSKNYIGAKLTTSLFNIHVKIQVLVKDISSGEIIEFANCKEHFQFQSHEWCFNTNIARDMLVKHADKYFHEGRLSLQFICQFSGKVSVNKLLEEREFSAHYPRPVAALNDALVEVSLVSEPLPNSDNEPLPKLKDNEPQAPHNISQAVQEMFKEGYLSDFNLKAGNRVFPVHRNILGMRSSVFHAMFASEMKEAQDNCVDIVDIDGDTLQRLLQFIYSDDLDKNMDYDYATSLYAAADKYALELLKQGCSKIIQSKFSVSNILEILSIADLYQDSKLKSASLDFISRNDNRIVGSKCWIEFEDDNAKLALETLRELYKRKMRN